MFSTPVVISRKPASIPAKKVGRKGSALIKADRTENKRVYPDKFSRTENTSAMSFSKGGKGRLHV